MANANVNSVEQELYNGKTVEVKFNGNGMAVRLRDSDGNSLGWKHLAPGEIERVVSDDGVQKHILLGHS